MRVGLTQQYMFYVVCTHMWSVKTPTRDQDQSKKGLFYLHANEKLTFNGCHLWCQIKCAGTRKGWITLQYMGAVGDIQVPGDGAQLGVAHSQDRDQLGTALNFKSLASLVDRLRLGMSNRELPCNIILNVRSNQTYLLKKNLLCIMDDPTLPQAALYTN